MSAHAATDKTQADTLRILSQLGYGGNPSLMHAVQFSGGTRSWVLQQVDPAYTASHQAPVIATDLRNFSVIALDASFGLHPAMDSLMPMWREGVLGNAHRATSARDAVTKLYSGQGISLRAAPRVLEERRSQISP
jgi:uncharacterized protein (DUF1501 family)